MGPLFEPNMKVRGQRCCARLTNSVHQEGPFMTKVLRCSDMMPGCDYVARAESEDQLMQKAATRLRETRHADGPAGGRPKDQEQDKIRDE